MTPYKLEAFNQAVSFRKRGFTYTEIAKICGVSRSTVSAWLKNEPFSQLVATDNAKKAVLANKKRLALVNKARTTERTNQYAQVLKTATTEYQHYRTSPLFIAGLMLYQAAGDMAATRVIRLSTHRLELQTTFIRFATAYLGVAKVDIRLWLLLYPDLDEVACMKYWCQKTGLSPAQFYKNQLILGRSSKKTLHHGIGNLILSNTILKKKLQIWILMLQNEINNYK